ncbi:endomembrane protein 70 [Lasiosphaeria miniovina]|uniref:Transmembrane 9 superfamily member n=1 Tax=Lasiosphaeria miniovina TaxID=1954250 RepID=A0AA40ALP2_9PEZI|nr:endomembrane protein 70 [Lasiosphaeria miniovina]KAK0718153.1 endomembrane protein 70 [Lasiosphaeria miniovina]
MDRSTRTRFLWSWTVLVLVLCRAANAFYIPGWSVKSYKENEPIPLLVNKVYSDNTQLQYAYFDLPFVCPPTGQRHFSSGLLSGQSIPLNLGEVLRGDRIVVSDVELAMRRDTKCAVLCSRAVGRGDLERARQMVEDGYVVEWIVDNLPGATSFVTVDKKHKYYAAGFKLGEADHSAERPRFFLNNHHTIVMVYRKAPGKAGDAGGRVVVGFEVYAKSIGPGNKRLSDGCPADLRNIDGGFELLLPSNGTLATGSSSAAAHAHPSSSSSSADDGDKLTIPYSYAVYWREDSSIEWNRRWDLYFVNQEAGSKIHWLAMVNSLFICGLLTGVVLMILTKTIRTDIKGYRDTAVEEGQGVRLLRRKLKLEKTLGLLDQVGSGGGRLSDDDDDDDDDDGDDDGEALEDVTGWKLLHGEVFRPPQHGHLLAPLVGSGTQLLFMAVGLVLLSALGVLNPSFRGGFISFGVGLFVFAGVLSGYFSGRIYKTLGGHDWRRNTVVTALLFPGLGFCAVFVLNLFVWAQASSTAIPFGTLVAVVALWLCVQLPLVYVGSWYGFARAGAWEHPTKTSTGGARRTGPAAAGRQTWWHALRTVLLAGLVPFTVIFIELLFVFQSVWQDKSGYYYVFGFLAVVSAILVCAVAEVTVVAIYLQLCAENHHWWWQSFFVGGGSALWVFAYSVWYFFARLHISGFLSSLLFFSYSFMACCVYGLLTGTVGFLAAYAFVRRIYG